MTLLGQMLMEDGIERRNDQARISGHEENEKGLSRRQQSCWSQKAGLQCINRIYAAMQANPVWMKMEFLNL